MQSKYCLSFKPIQLHDKMTTTHLGPYADCPLSHFFAVALSLYGTTSTHMPLVRA